MVIFDGHNQTLIDQVWISQDANVATIRQSVRTNFSPDLDHVSAAKLEVLVNRTGTPALEPDAQIEQSYGHSRHEPIYVRCPVPAQGAAAGEGESWILGGFGVPH